MKPTIKQESMWAVYGTRGIFCASNCPTRVDAIQRHLQDMGEVSWESCKKKGDRVIRVTITPKTSKP